jgi:hypothetical protein
MLQITERAMTKEHCAIRLCVADDGFAVAAIANNGIVLASGWGKTLEEAMRDMLEDLGVLAAKEEACMIMT